MSYNPNNPNGQATSANSAPVVIASDQSAVPVSATALPLPSGASTAANQTNVQSSPGTSATTALTIQGSATGVAVPVSVSSLPSIPAGSNAIGSVSVSNFPATQPISGTVTANAGTGTFGVSASSLPLPTGAATAALQTTANSNLTTIATDLTNGTQKTQIVDTTNTPISQITSGGTNNLTVAQSATNFVLSTSNSSMVQLAAGASFTGTIETAFNQQSFSVLLTSDQPGTLYVYNYIDSAGTFLAQTLTYAIAAGTGFSQSGVINGNYISVKFTNSGASATTTFNISTAYGTIPSATNLNNTPMSLNEVNGTSLTLGQKAASASIPVVLASGSTVSTTSSTGGTAIANAPVYNLYSSTNITTSAYTQLVASTSNAVNTIHIFDSSGQGMILATGASGSEVIQLYVPPGGDTYTLTIPASTRIAYKALTANATAGYLLMSFLK